MTSTRGRPRGWHVLLRTLLLCGAALVVSPVWAGQSSDATIFGLVTDESGAVLPGVTVTVSGPALQVKQIVQVTAASGEYRVTPLPLGLYTVEYTLAGFQTQRREGLRLTAGFVAKVDVQLKVGAVEETVTVSGVSPVVDVKTTSAGTQLTQGILESVPTSRNGFQSMLTLGAGARPAQDLGLVKSQEPAFKAFGVANQAWVLVDGIPTTSPYSGNSGFFQDFEYGSIEESTIQTLGSSAESPTAGIQLSVITKSGGNAFHGGGTVAQTAHWTQADNLDDRLRAQGITVPTSYLRRWDRGGDLGGPIEQDNLWFYGTLRMRTESLPNAGAFNADGSPALTTTNQYFAVGKITKQLTSSQKLIASGQWMLRQSDFGPESFLNATDHIYVRKQFNNLGTVEWQRANGNKSLSLQGGGFVADYPLTVLNASLPPFWSDQVTSRNGGFYLGSQNHLDVRRWTGKGTMDWYQPELFLGNHDFKTGANYMIASGDSSRGDLGEAGSGNYTLTYRSGVPFQISVLNDPDTPRSRLDYLGIFFQDSWAINRRLTLNLGVRYANDSSWLPAQCRVDAPAPFTSVYPAQCFPESHINTWNPVAPRLHAAYDMTGDGKTVIKGGYGRFHVMHTQDELNLFNPNAGGMTTFSWHAPSGLEGQGQTWLVGQSNLDLNGTDFVSRTNANANLVGLVNNPDLKENGSNEFSLSLERQLIANFGLRITGLYTHNFNSIRVLNTFRTVSTYNIPITNPIPAPNGQLLPGNPYGTITYYDYPASLAGLAFQRLMLINDANANASFKSFEIASNKRLSNRWQFLGSFSATKRHIPWVATVSGGTAYAYTAYNPNDEINTADNTWEWLARLSGSYVFPADVLVSANVASQSGDAYARTVSFKGGTQIPSITLRVEPIGSQRLERQTVVTFRAEKAFRLGVQGNKLIVGANIINLLNTNYVSALVQASGTTFQNATGIANPRLGEVLVRYTF